MSWFMGLMYLLALYETANEPDDIRDPAAKIASMQEHIDRLHKRIEERDERIKELEVAPSDTDALNAERIRTEFLSAVLRREDKIDLDTTWDLAKVRGFMDTVTLADDGVVVGMDDALAKVLERYPWLLEASPEREDPRPTGPSGAPIGGKKRRDPSSSAVLSTAPLQKRFPALRKNG